MALIGRHKHACISCGFPAPHVKRNEGKLPYVHCPECGLMTVAKNGQQATGLLANMRPETGAPVYTPGDVPQIPRRPDDIVIKADAPAAPAAPPAAPAPPQRRASPWAPLLGVTK